MAKAGTVTVDFIAEVGGMIRNIDRASNEINRNFKRIEKQASEFGRKLGTAIVAVAGAAGLGALVKSSIDAADQLSKLSQSTGISTEKLSALKFAAGQSGVEFNNLQKSLQQLARRSAEAATGAQEYAEVFDRVGVSVKDSQGNLKSLDDLFGEIADRFQKLPNDTAKAATAIELFGRSGAELIPLLNGGSEGLDKFREKAEQLGLIVGGDFASASERLNDSLDRLRQLVDGVVIQALSELVPIIVQLVESYEAATVGQDNAARAGQQLAESLKPVVTGLVLAKNTVDVFVDGLKVAVRVAAAFAASVVEAFRQTATDLEALGEAIANPFDDKTITDVFKRGVDARKRILEQFFSEAEGASKEFRTNFTRNIQDVSDAFSAAYGPAVEDSRQGTARLTDELLDFSDKSGDAAKAAKELAKRLKELKEAQDKAVDGSVDLSAALDAEDQKTADLISELQFEIQLIRASFPERERLIALRQAGAFATGEEIQRIEELIKVLAAERQIAEAAAEFESIWLDATESVGDALTTLLVDGFDEGADAIKDAAKQLVRDLIRFFIQQRIVIPLQAQLAGGGMPGGGGSFSSFFQKPTSTFGQVAGFAAGAYGVYDTYRNGPGGLEGGLSGAASGAMAGASVGGPVGAIVGAIIGGLAGIFGGSKPPDIRLGGTGSGVRKPETSFETVFGTQQLGTRGGIQYEPIIDAVRQFDQAIADIVSSIEGGDEQLDAIRAALAQWSVDLQGDAANIENVLGSRFEAILATFDEDVQQFVRGAGDLQAQVQALADYLARPGQIQAILDALAREDYLAGLSEFDRQLYLLNEQFDAIAAQAAALGASEAQLAEIEQYRTRAIERLTEAQTELDEAVELFDPEALREYADFITGINDELIRMDQSDFQNALRDIAQQFNENVARANELARAAGLQAAREEDLARIHQLAARQAAEALRQLEDATRNLVADLYGTPLSRIEAEIERIQRVSGSAAGGLGRVADSLQKASQIASATLQFGGLRGQELADFALQALGRGEISLSEALQAGQQVFASGADFNSFFNQATDIFGRTQATQPADPVSSQLEALFAQRDALIAEQQEAGRRVMAADLAQNLADIAGFTGEDFAEVAERLGFTLDDLAADLGLDSIDALTEYLLALQSDTASFDDLPDRLNQTFEDFLNELRDILLPTDEIIGDGFTKPEPIPGPVIKAGFTKPELIPGPVIEDPVPDEPTPEEQTLEEIRDLLDRYLDRIDRNGREQIGGINQLNGSISRSELDVFRGSSRSSRNPVFES